MTAPAELHVTEMTVGLLGGLALFLYGMRKMSDALKSAAGERLKTLLRRLTSNRFKAALTGTAITAIIQSSSVTTVLVVGFVSAGLMTLEQSIGVIMGANIGTTITAQIVAFKITSYAWLMVAAGFGLASFSRRDQLRHFGAMFLGLGMLFLGMDQMSGATSPLRDYAPFLQLMRRMDQPFWGLLLGAAFTALVQSSSATTGLVILLASQGFLSLEAGIALAIGANVGTCVTAVLSAFGKRPEALRAALVHVLFNLIGAVLWLGFIGQLAEVARWVSPARADLEGAARLAAETPRQIANANTLFNVANTLVMIWFVKPLGALATRLVPRRLAGEPEVVQPRFLDAVYLNTPPLALDRVRLELGHLGDHVVRMMQAAPPIVLAGSRAELQRIARMDDDVDRLHVAILDYLRMLGRGELSEQDAQLMGNFLAAANYLENTGDLISTNLVAQGEQRLDKQLRISPWTIDVLRPLGDEVVRALQDALTALVHGDPSLAADVVGRKAHVYGKADEAMEHLSRRLLVDEPHRLDAFRVESDIVGQIKRLFYNARRIAKLAAEGGAAEDAPAREGKEA